MTRYLPFYRYKKHLGLDVNVKNARVRARAEVSCGRYDAIPCGWWQEVRPLLSLSLLRR
jgi:hypothetical protein